MSRIRQFAKVLAGPVFPCPLEFSDYESGGQEFESLRARQQNQALLAFFLSQICHSVLGRSWADFLRGVVTSEHEKRFNEVTFRIQTGLRSNPLGEQRVARHVD